MKRKQVKSKKTKEKFMQVKPQSIELGGVRVHVDKFGAVLLKVPNGMSGEGLQRWYDTRYVKVRRFVSGVHKTAKIQ